MRKIFFLLLFFIPISIGLSQNKLTMNDDDYKNDWLKVAEFEQKSLPQSAVKIVDNILLKAIKAKDSPQVIKALIHQGKYDLVVDYQNDTNIFGNLTDMLEKSSDVVEKSVIHSMLGELYIQYYSANQWTINQRTELADFVPADMKEWTKNIFYTKAVEHLNASIYEQNELINAKVETYTAVVELGKDSRRFYPTMYDFLTRRAIEQFRQIGSDEDLSRTLAKKGVLQESLFAPSEEFVNINFNPGVNDYNLWVFETFRKHLVSLQDRELNESVLLTQLDLLENLSVLQNRYESHAKSALEGLLKKWEGKPISVEIIDNLASFYQDQIWKIDEKSDSAQKVEKERELYELLKKGIDRYPNYERISVLENMLSQLTFSQFNVTGNRTFPLNSAKKLTVSFRSVKSLTASLYRIDSPVDERMAQSGIDYNIKRKRTFIKNIEIPLPETPEYLTNDTTFIVDVDAPGTYMITFDSNPKMDTHHLGNDYFFAVSDLAVFTRSTTNNKFDFIVVDRVTGSPIRNATINIYKLPGNWRNSSLTHIESIKTNKEGYATYNKSIPNNDVYYSVVIGSDNGSLLSRLPFANSGYSTPEISLRESTQIFTDRSLFRPGQIVYFKAIHSRTVDNNQSIVTDKDIEFVLKDANNREVSKQVLRTNEFGSASGEFVLPQGALPGNFTIETVNGSISIKVEEYKRPTFEVSFDKIEETYKFGEEITLSGKTESFSGIKLQNALVEWKITRQQTWWRFWGGTTEHYAEGSVYTDDEGEFKIKFTPDKSDSRSSGRSIFSFVVDATVTDINGETQVGSYMVTVGDVSMILLTEMPARFEKNSDEQIVVTAKNLDGADIEAEGAFQIFSLHENDSINKLMTQGEFIVGEQEGIKNELRKMSSGKYRLKLESKDDRGNRIEAENDFVLFSYNDKRPPIKTNEWYVVKSAVFSPNKPAEVILGASDNVSVLYELWQENSLLERKWLKLNNENEIITIPYNKSYENGVTLLLTYVKDEIFYSHKTELRLKKEQSDLKVRMDVFRDKIRPGTEEEWRVTVTDMLGNPSDGEVLASMYDFSLDKIYPSHPWDLTIYSYDRYKSIREFTQDQSFFTEYSSANITIPNKNIVPFEFDRFNWFGYSLYSGRFSLRGVGRTGMNENIVLGYGQPKIAKRVSEESAEFYSLDSSIVPSALQSSQSGLVQMEERQLLQTGELQVETAQVRRNFNETAFFYPQLRTNDKGETQIAFTVPESNTRWRFRVFAHNKTFDSGQTEAFTVSQKELMVTPNMPRFLRLGDKTTISTKISNLSDKIQIGKVGLEFFDPVTEERLSNITLINKEQDFSLQLGASSDAVWTFDVPSGIDVIGVRVVAKSDSFSDGEQHSLAVLSNRILVTESMRMDISGNETKTFTMDRLLKDGSSTREDYRLTLEFASNPAWYAVQALPVLGVPTSENAVSWFASYYANSLGAHIGKAYPKVSAMIDLWKKQGGDAETLISNLEKNQELKNILLEETPWVVEAKNETEQKEKLSLLFDINRSRNLTQTALTRLKELQSSEGGWSWFKGFRPSVSITQYILYGFNQLSDLKSLDISDDILSMQSSAVSFIDAEAIRRFEALKKYNKDWKNIKYISVTDLEYLFVRSSYNHHPKDNQVSEMYKFYGSVIEKNWTTFGLYERSLIALFLQKERKNNIVQDILKSFREHAVVSEEMGMYWANNRANVFMSQSAVSVHTFIMDAFGAGGASAEEIDNMKRWLLKQKQTQLWETTHATADAVYALLSTGTDWFASGGETVVTLGSNLIEPDKSEAGTDYFKESWNRTEVSPEMGEVIVEHNGETPAWGALYWQYFEEMDKVSKTDASLDVEKLFFIEKTDSEGTKLILISDDTELKVGDKVVVRLTLRTDREHEFVHIKDVRAVCFEPVNQVSGLSWKGGVPYYQTVKDASTNFYFDSLPRGTYIFEYTMFVNRTGSYSAGLATVQSMYAPEFTSHTEGIRIEVTK